MTAISASEFDEPGKGRITYEGDWVGGQRHGKGNILPICANGHVYEGDFVGGEWHGQGKLTKPDGHCYEGFFEHNKAQGKGKVTLVNGDV